MKLVVFTILLLMQLSFVKAQNVVWTKVSDDHIDEVIRKATNERKQLFFFFYVDWDEQAREMLNHVFRQSDVARLYNASFVSVPFNLGEGQGRSLVKRYGIRGTPALVFVDTNQKLLKVANNRALVSSRAVLKAARLALGDPNEKEWSYYKKKYEAGHRDWQFLEQYINERSLATMLPAPYELILEYVNAVPESTRYQNKNVRRYILVNALPGNQLYDMLREHHTSFPEWKNQEARISYLTQMMMRSRTSSTNSMVNIKEQLSSDFGQASFPALEYFEILRMLGSHESPAFVTSYFEFVKRENLPATFYSNILSVVLNQGQLKKEYAELMLRDLGQLKNRQHHSWYLDAVLAFLLINANRKNEAVMYARSLVDGLKYYPQNEIEEKSVQYLRDVSKGIISGMTSYYDNDY